MDLVVVYDLPLRGQFSKTESSKTASKSQIDLKNSPFSKNAKTASIPAENPQNERFKIFSKIFELILVKNYYYLFQQSSVDGKSILSRS